jgi:hypothetical protein
MSRKIFANFSAGSMSPACLVFSMIFAFSATDADLFCKSVLNEKSPTNFVPGKLFVALFGN